MLSRTLVNIALKKSVTVVIKFTVVSIVQIVTLLYDYISSWYIGETTRGQAETVLSNEPLNVFVVYKEEQKNSYIFCTRQALTRIDYHQATSQNPLILGIVFQTLTTSQNT